MNFRVVDGAWGVSSACRATLFQLRGEWAQTPSLIPPPGGEGLTLHTANLAPSPNGGGRGEGEEVKHHTAWDFGDFKPINTEQRAGQTITVFNALVDVGDAVMLQTFDTRDTAQAAHRLGLRRIVLCWR